MGIKGRHNWQSTGYGGDKNEQMTKEGRVVKSLEGRLRSLNLIQ